MDHVSFPSDDEPDGPECPQLHIMVGGNFDYYLAVAPGDRWPATRNTLRASTDGTKNFELVFLVAAMYRLGKGDAEGAVHSAQAFVREVGRISRIDADTVRMLSHGDREDLAPEEGDSAGARLRKAQALGVLLERKLAEAHAQLDEVRKLWQARPRRGEGAESQEVAQPGESDAPAALDAMTQESPGESVSLSVSHETLSKLDEMLADQQQPSRFALPFRPGMMPQPVPDMEVEDGVRMDEVLTKEDGQEPDGMVPSQPYIFSCGCSRRKVEMGMCDIFGPDGMERT